MKMQISKRVAMVGWQALASAGPRALALGLAIIRMAVSKRAADNC